MIEEITAVSKIDYIVINHMEPDHTGLLRIFRRLAPQAVILGSAKTKEMLRGFFGVGDNVRAVADGETLDLGGATAPKFLSTPFVHWPETIMTYEESRKVLFSCDAFGGYGALRGTIFDDECAQPEFYEKEALRYYANIVANYSSRVLDAIAKLAALPVDIVAPSHGLVWRRSPQRIVDLYRRWAECASGKTEPAVTLIYGSMYGNTERMMNAVAIGHLRGGRSRRSLRCRQDARQLHPALPLDEGGCRDRRAHLRGQALPADGRGPEHGRQQTRAGPKGRLLRELRLERRGA